MLSKSKEKTCKMLNMNIASAKALLIKLAKLCDVLFTGKTFKSASRCGAWPENPKV